MYRIPEHFVVIKEEYPYTNTEVAKRGGYIDRVKFTVPSSSDFSTKFGKKVKALDGNYSTCRGSGYYGSYRQVSFEWGNMKAAKLLEAIISYHWSEKKEYIQVDFCVGSHQFQVYVDKQGLPASEMVKQAAQKIQERMDDPDARIWRTAEEAQAYIDEKVADVEQAELVRAQKREVQANLIKAFNQAGFPTTSLTDLRFDVKTSKKLIEFLQESVAP